MKIGNLYLRFIIGVFSVGGLVVMYLIMQHTDVAAWIGIEMTEWRFIVNKTIRFIANDCLMVGVIYALFYERKYVVFSLWVQVFGFVGILVPYLLLKVVFHAGNGPLVSFLHRLALNPTLLLLLIPAFYYQQGKNA